METLNDEVKKLLLTKREVVEEINRHLWIESEKVGANIGFEKAAEDWLKNFAVVWIRYHMPDYKTAPSASETSPVPPKNKSKTPRIKKRSARSYYTV